MKKITIIAILCFVSYGSDIFGEAINDSFTPQTHTRFLEISHKNDHNNTSGIETLNIAAMEEYNESIDEYDKTVSVNTKPIILSPIQRFFANIFGKLLVYYFAARDSIASYYKQYKNKLMFYAARKDAH